MDYAKFMRELRGDYSFIEYENITGITFKTQKAYEEGVQVPTPKSINKIAANLNWSDKKRMSLMPKPRLGGLSGKLERHMQFLDLSDVDLANMFDCGSPTINGWKNVGVPKKNRTLVQNFLTMDHDEAYQLLWLKTGNVKDVKKVAKAKRKKLPYELIHELEKKYGALSNVDESDPLLIELRDKVGGKYSRS